MAGIAVGIYATTCKKMGPKIQKMMKKINIE